MMQQKELVSLVKMVASVAAKQHCDVYYVLRCLEVAVRAEHNEVLRENQACAKDLMIRLFAWAKENR